MSRWHRMNPERGHEQEPPPSPLAKHWEAAHAPDEESPESVREPQGLCMKHPVEHWRANENEPAVACPVCFNEANEKAYDRKARLAEHAEELVSAVKGWMAARGSSAKVIAYERMEKVLSKIETPEEGNKP